MANPNLTTGQLLPGFFGYVDYNSQGAGAAPTRRALLWGYTSSSAQRTPNYPFLPASQQEVDDGAGRGSDLANAYAAAVSQPDAQGCDVWCMPIAENSGGTAATYQFKVIIPGTTPTKSGTMQLWIASKPAPAVGFTTSDTDATIAAALRDQLNTMADSPFGTVTAAGAVLTIPYRHKGASGEDFPVRCNISPNGTGVYLAATVATFATAATGAGSVKFTFGSQTVSTALAGGESAAQVAAKVITSFNSDTYPLKAVAGTSTEAILYFANDKDVRRIGASLVTTTGTTVTLGGGTITNGAGDPTSVSYNGTSGAGNPSLSAALSNLANLDEFRSWASGWNDTTSVSAMATNIETSSDGSITGQKQQHLTLASADAASVAGAIATSSSPNLTTAAPHYAILWCPDSAVQNLTLASRAAVARAAKWLDTPQFNWNAFQLLGNTAAPILIPSSKPSITMQNTALRTYALAPIVAGSSGNLEIVKGRTTSLANDHRLWAWSTEAQAAYHAIDLALFFQSRFQGGSIVRYGVPKAPGLFDKTSFESATRERMRFWELNGNYDGAEQMSPAVKATPNGNNPFRVDVDFPESPVLDLDQVVFSGHFTNPST